MPCYPIPPYTLSSRPTSFASSALSSSLASSSFSISSAVFLFFSILLSFSSFQLLIFRLYHCYYLMFHDVSHATSSPGFSQPIPGLFPLGFSLRKQGTAHLGQCCQAKKGYSNPGSLAQKASAISRLGHEPIVAFTCVLVFYRNYSVIPQSNQAMSPFHFE